MLGARCRNRRRQAGGCASIFATPKGMVTTEARCVSLKCQCLPAELCLCLRTCTFATPSPASSDCDSMRRRKEVAPFRLTSVPATRHRGVNSCKVKSMLPDGYSDVPAGKLAAVVTCLEMRAPPPGRADPEQAGIVLQHIARPEIAWYRDLYGRIGAEWLWASRLAMAEADLKAILHHPDVEVYAVMKDGQGEGLLELDFRPDAGHDRQRHRALADEPGDRTRLVAGRASADPPLLGAYLHARRATGSVLLHSLGIHAGQAPGGGLRRSADNGHPAGNGGAGGADPAALRRGMP
jgi:hypothetical protein